MFCYSTNSRRGVEGTLTMKPCSGEFKSLDPLGLGKQGVLKISMTVPRHLGVFLEQKKKERRLHERE